MWASSVGRRSSNPPPSYCLRADSRCNAGHPCKPPAHAPCSPPLAEHHLAGHQAQLAQHHLDDRHLRPNQRQHQRAGWSIGWARRTVLEARMPCCHEPWLTVPAAARCTNCTACRRTWNASPVESMSTSTNSKYWSMDHRLSTCRQGVRWGWQGAAQQVRASAHR